MIIFTFCKLLIVLNVCKKLIPIKKVNSTENKRNTYETTINSEIFLDLNIGRDAVYELLVSSQLMIRDETCYPFLMWAFV